MNKNRSPAEVIEISDVRKTHNKEELRKGSRINVERQNISGLLHTESETAEGEWEEKIQYIHLKDIGKEGFQVTTDENTIPEYIGTVIFNVHIDDSDRLLDIDASHEWARVTDDKLLLGFKYRNPHDSNIQILLDAAIA